MRDALRTAATFRWFGNVCILACGASPNQLGAIGAPHEHYSLLRRIIRDGAHAQSQQTQLNLIFLEIKRELGSFLR